MLFRSIWEIKVFSDCIECVLFIPFYVAKVFSKSVAWLSSYFANEYLFLGASYAIDDIGGLDIGEQRITKLHLYPST